jgi:hypothetical protein
MYHDIGVANIDVKAAAIMSGATSRVLEIENFK